jgi:hypothetical protein
VWCGFTFHCLQAHMQRWAAQSALEANGNAAISTTMQLEAHTALQAAHHAFPHRMQALVHMSKGEKQAACTEFREKHAKVCVVVALLCAHVCQLCCRRSNVTHDICCRQRQPSLSPALLPTCPIIPRRAPKPLQGLVQEQVWVLSAIVGSATTLRLLSAQVRAHCFFQCTDEIYISFCKPVGVIRWAHQLSVGKRVELQQQTHVMGCSYHVLCWCPPPTPPPKHTHAQVDDEALRRGGGVSSSSQLQQCAMMLQGLFGKTAAAKGSEAELKRAAAVAIGCVMLKVGWQRCL